MPVRNRASVASAIALVLPSLMAPPVSAQAPADLERALSLVDYACYYSRASDQLAGKQFQVQLLNALQNGARLDVTIGRFEELCTPVVKGDDVVFEEALENESIGSLMHIDYARYAIDGAEPAALPQPLFTLEHLNPALTGTAEAVATLVPRALLTPVFKGDEPPVGGELVEALKLVDYVCYALESRDGALPFTEVDVLNLNPILERSIDHIAWIGRLGEVCLPAVKGHQVTLEYVRSDAILSTLAEVDRADYEAESVGSLTRQTLPIGHLNPLFAGLADKVEAFHISHILTPVAKTAAPPPQGRVLWVNPLDLRPGDPSVTTSNDALSSGVGGGLAGLVIGSSTTGEAATGGGNKVVWMGLQVPPDWDVTGVRVCYELTAARSHISQVRLAQLQDPPATVSVLLDDSTDHTAIGPVCVDSQATIIHPEAGALFIHLRVAFGDTSDRIVVRGLGLFVEPA
jgi:hypothetical protein